MKALVIVILLCFAAIQGFCQVTVVSPIRENIIYLGIDNAIDVVVENNPCSYIFLKTDNGQIKGENCQYYIHPDRLGTARIDVLLISNKDTNVIDRKYLRVRNIPDPIVKIADKKHGLISKNELIVQLGISASFEDFDINAHIHVKSWKMIIIRGHNALFLKENIGAKFSKDIQEGLNLLQSLDSVLFYDIITVLPDSREVRLNTMEFLIE